MDKVRNTFEVTYKKFATKRSFFKKRIEKFSSDGKMDLHKKGHELLSEADKLVLQIRESFENGDTSDLKAQVKRFSRVYKNLVELTKYGVLKYVEALFFAVVVVIILRNLFFGFYRIANGSGEPNLLVGDRVLSSKLAYNFTKNSPKRGDLVIFSDPNFQYSKNPMQSLWQKRVGFSILGFGSGPENIIKRVVAIPGDVIEGRVENNKTVIYLNGKRLNEEYVNTYPLIALEKRTGFFDINRIGFISMPDVLKRQSKYPVFYTYVPDLEFSAQPYYNLSSESVGLEPGTLRPWLLMQGVPRKSEVGLDIDIFGPLKLPKGKYWVMGDNRIRSADSRLWGLLDKKQIHGQVTRVIYSIDSEEPFWIFELIKNPIRFWSKSIRWKRFFKRL